ncbi:hypothetical protein GGI05_006284, partial [Coemansia sp. RSA 2603]
TDAATHAHLPNAALPAIRGKTAAAMVGFIQTHGLGGIDIDWEYPEKPDEPGMGAAGESANYLELLKEIRHILPAGKTLSIAAPASYWYLKAFPIAEMSKYLDYIVYMTYDLHGQWDYGNPWTGQYLRSHVNWTETEQALALITHAGVPSNKVLLGLAAYGRSFKQVYPNCAGPNCMFAGPESGATPGSCTGTAGYISMTELEGIRVTSGRVRSEYTDSGSTVMLYDTDQWVSYNTRGELDRRQQLAAKMNLGGTVMWALDLLGGDGQVAESPCNVKQLSYPEMLNTTCIDAQLAASLVSWIDKLVPSLQTMDMRYANALFNTTVDNALRISGLQQIKQTLSGGASGTSASLTRAAGVDCYTTTGAFIATRSSQLFNERLRRNPFVLVLNTLAMGTKEAIKYIAQQFASQKLRLDGGVVLVPTVDDVASGNSCISVKELLANAIKIEIDWNVGDIAQDGEQYSVGTVRAKFDLLSLAN